ncbi:MAG: hypothetical protein HOH77_10535, partial [Candidatus Latescibacteria bacterium]|nr:hypothetical protein [Candidatus Latescibacterota bacterium]
MKHVLFCLSAIALLVHTPQAQDVQTSIYGYMKLDIAYDTNLSSHGNFIMYVRPQPQKGTTNTLSFTARQTRLGLKLNREGAKGIIELDFYGG